MASDQWHCSHKNNVWKWLSLYMLPQSVLQSFSIPYLFWPFWLVLKFLNQRISSYRQSFLQSFWNVSHCQHAVHWCGHGNQWKHGQSEFSTSDWSVLLGEPCHGTMQSQYQHHDKYFYPHIIHEVWTQKHLEKKDWGKISHLPSNMWLTVQVCNCVILYYQYLNWIFFQWCQWCWHLFEIILFEIFQLTHQY